MAATSTASAVVPTVVAQGASARALQFASPIYFSEWISDTHVVVGAGGGGQRFGMANVLALLSIVPNHNSTSQQLPSATEAKAAKKKSAAPSQKKGGATTEATSTSLPLTWKFEHALDLGDCVPWCHATFIPAKAVRSTTATSVRSPVGCDEGATSSTLFGYFVVSHMESFSLIRVCSSGGGPNLFLECARTVPLIHDPENPDKKCIAAIDYRATSPHSPAVAAAGNESEDTTTNTQRHGDKKSKGTANKDTADAIVVAVAQDNGTIRALFLPVTTSPIASSSADDNKAAHDPNSSNDVGGLQAATWTIGCRANDLSMRRCAVSPASASAAATATPATAPSSILVTAAMQDKHIYLARLSYQRPVVATTGGAVPGPVVFEWAPLCRLDGAACGLPFRAMRGSLKFARILSSRHVLLVAYDAASGWSYVNVGHLSVSDVGNKTIRLDFPSTVTAARVVAEGVTAFCPIDEPPMTPTTGSSTSGPHSSTAAAVLPGPSVLPKRWLMATVDGSVLEVAIAEQSTGGVSAEVTSTRPHPSLRNKRRGTAPAHLAALHEEPVSSISLAPNNRVVVTTDIAQKLVMSTTRYGSSVSCAPPKSQQNASSLCEGDAWALLPPVGGGGATTGLLLRFVQALGLLLLVWLVAAALWSPAHQQTPPASV